MSNWHYQVMYHKESNTYAIHEYFQLPDDDKKPDHVFPYDGWTKDPVSIVGEDVEDIKDMLRMMLDDIEKHGVKDYDDE